MENREEEFEDLPFEMQMKIMHEKKRLEEMVPYIEGIADVTIHHNDFLKEISEDTDTNSIKTKLFLEAERLDSLKSSKDGQRLFHEIAREYDWIRHVVSELGIDAAELAAEAVKLAMMGDFKRSAILGRSMKSHVDEYEKILSYWEKAINGD